MQKIKLILKIFKAEKYMLILPKGKTALDVETTFEAKEYSRSKNAIYFDLK